MDKVGTEGNDKINARPESAQNNENVTILKDCENEQEKNSGTQRQFKRWVSTNADLKKKNELLKLILKYKEQWETSKKSTSGGFVTFAVREF